MRRQQVAEALKAELDEQIVIASLGSAGRAWREFGGDNPTFYSSDPMGAAPGIALGAALARPDREFVLLEGDGDLTMNLGSLLAIAGSVATNLKMVVFANHRYETGGGQPLANAERLDIAGIAAAAGWGWTKTLDFDTSDADLRACIREMCAVAGPAIIVARVITEASPYGGPGEHSGAEAQFVFREQIRQLDLKKTRLMEEEAS